jgi:hypothetical protein
MKGTVPRASRECIYNIASVRAKARLRGRVANWGTKSHAARLGRLLQALNFHGVVGQAVLRAGHVPRQRIQP